MATYFTADLHLGHANIIGYCGRPFPDLAAMDEALVRAWNETVSPTDTVWVLGDVALGRIEDSLAHVARLAGTKVLVPGNHDRCWAGHGTRAATWHQRYLDAGFDAIDHDPPPFPLAGHDVSLCHFPHTGDSHDTDRFTSHRPVDDGSWLLHGHVHESYRQRGRCINVGVDAWGGRPVDLDEIAGLIGHGPGELAPRPWPVPLPR